MSEIELNPEARQAELSSLGQDIERLTNRVAEAQQQESDTVAEEEAQGQLNKAKYRRYEISNEGEREALLIGWLENNASSYEELVEVGMPVGVEQILFDAYGEAVEISDELRNKLYQMLEQYEWWNRSEHYDV